MLRNLELTDGMILSEAIMMELGRSLGRQEAHDVVYDAVEAVLAGGATFARALHDAPAIRAALSPDAIDALLDPAAYTGLCARMATEQAALARDAARALRPRAGS